MEFMKHMLQRNNHGDDYYERVKAMLGLNLEHLKQKRETLCVSAK